jgi:hypothetical protein
VRVPVHRAAGATMLIAVGLLGLLLWRAAAAGLTDLIDGRVTQAGVGAFIDVACWLTLAVLSVATVVGVWSRSPGTRPAPSRGRLDVLAVLVGLALLGGGIARHQSAYRACCPTADSAREAQRLVH